MKKQGLDVISKCRLGCNFVVLFLLSVVVHVCVCVCFYNVKVEWNFLSKSHRRKLTKMEAPF
jgi:uncharacterized membrane protein